MVSMIDSWEPLWRCRLWGSSLTLLYCCTDGCEWCYHSGCEQRLEACPSRRSTTVNCEWVTHPLAMSMVIVSCFGFDDFVDVDCRLDAAIDRYHAGSSVSFQHSATVPQILRSNFSIHVSWAHRRITIINYQLTMGQIKPSSNYHVTTIKSIITSHEGFPYHNM